MDASSVPSSLRLLLLILISLLRPTRPTLTSEPQRREGLTKLPEGPPQFADDLPIATCMRHPGHVIVEAIIDDFCTLRGRLTLSSIQGNISECAILESKNVLLLQSLPPGTYALTVTSDVVYCQATTPEVHLDLYDNCLKLTAINGDKRWTPTLTDEVLEVDIRLEWDPKRLTVDTEIDTTFDYTVSYVWLYRSLSAWVLSALFL